jgi:Fur family transcriptional regulator, peroxide stress response regulator
MDRFAITKRMKTMGLRITPQRYSVYANLLGRSDHPTVEQILADLNQEFSISSKATVYTTLTALKEVGLIREVRVENGVSRFDANTEQHHHFCCHSCGAIADIDWQVFAPPIPELLPKGMQIKSYDAIIHGLCDRCQDSD